MANLGSQSELDNLYSFSPLLASVRNLDSGMTAEERRLFARQLVVLLRDYYVHLPLKRSSLGTDPVQEASLLVDEVQFIPTDTVFFRRVFQILKSLRDRHTAVRLPSPWREMVAFLPFVVESYFDEFGRHLIVSRVLADVGEPTFVPGVEITHWNGTAIGRHIENLSWDSDGANPFARIAVTLRALTVRPLGYMAQPSEDWVDLTYLTPNGQYRMVPIPWRVYFPGFGSAAAAANVTASGQAVLFQGLDRSTLIVNNTWQDFYSRLAIGADSGVAALSNIRSSVLNTPVGDFGYIRIFSFDAPDALAFVNAFAGLLGQMPPDGLIIDLRANPGGTIPAGEALMALFTDQVTHPQPVGFRNTEAVRRLGQLSAFAKWKRSLEMQFETGEVFSQEFPLTEEYNGPRGIYRGKVVLVIDALCYSTTDFFAAGMQDHGLATIIGVDPVTGAGGANVWNHGLLQQFATQAGGQDLLPMPSNVDIDIAVRRSIRVGPSQGLPVEGLGVFANEFYQMTRRDVLEQNQDLITFAVQSLARQM